MTDTYEALAFCRNCAYEGPVHPPVGVYVSSVTCPVCACVMLVPVADREWERERRGVSS